MENKIKHLEMIQGIISRMAGNSFALKGWAVTLIAGIFALSHIDTNKIYFLITYIPIIVFWGLDSYYLYQERLFRKLYDDVSKKDPDFIDFKMNTSLYKNINTKKDYISCLVSATELGFYLPLAFICACVIIITSII